MKIIKIFLVCLIFKIIFLFFIFTITPFSIGICRGKSMEPSLREGDFVFLLELNSNYQVNYQIKKGDIVIYLDDGINVVHRVVKLVPSEKIVIVKGDANNYIERIAFSQIKEVVLFKIPIFHFFSDFVFFIKKQLMAMIHSVI